MSEDTAGRLGSLKTIFPSIDSSNAGQELLKTDNIIDSLKFHLLRLRKLSSFSNLQLFIWDILVLLLFDMCLYQRM